MSLQLHNIVFGTWLADDGLPVESTRLCHEFGPTSQLPGDVDHHIDRCVNVEYWGESHEWKG